MPFPPAAKAINIADLKKLARRRLPRILFDWVEGGAEDERGLARNEGQFKRIRMTVKDRPLVFDGLRLIYSNGEEEPIPVKGLVGPDATSGPFDLKDGNRAPKEIQMRYRSTIADAKAKSAGFAIVEVWGQH